MQTGSAPSWSLSGPTGGVVSLNLTWPVTGLSGASRSRLWLSSWPAPSRGARPGPELWEAGFAGRAASVQEAPAL